MYPAPGMLPLIDITMSTVQRDAGLPEVTHVVLREQVQAYLEQRMTFAEAADAFQQCVGTSAPLDRLREIINMNDSPLPSGTAHTSRPKRGNIRRWTLWEDQRLLAGIYRFGLDSWHVVADFVGNDRSRAQCCQRWCRGLNPAISKDGWTPDKDEQLLTLVALHGNKNWTQIACELGDRCDVQCRYRYNQLSKAINFDQRMRIAAERARGMCHVKRPRKKPAKRPTGMEEGGNEPVAVGQALPGRVRLPPITELEAAIALLSREAEARP
jgi:hypothetical protein